MRMVSVAALPLIRPSSRPTAPAGTKWTSMPISLMSVVRSGQSGAAILSILAA
jgi:hypothetical protein